MHMIGHHLDLDHRRSVLDGNLGDDFLQPGVDATDDNSAPILQVPDQVMLAEYTVQFVDRYDITSILANGVTTIGTSPPKAA
jgi:hypothetical protein